ncbi:type VI secretion system contractile sheath small subunit [Cystobacter fuscus]
MKERKFVEIDRDNFDQVMAAIGPLLRLSVPDKLRDGDGRMAVELRFESIDSFHPRQLVEQIEPLRKLLESRQRLVDLIAKLDGNDALADVLRSALADRAGLQALQSELATKREP